MTASTTEVGLGDRVWLDGAVWVVQELDRGSVRLGNGTSMRVVAVSDFLTRVAVVDEHPGGDQAHADLVAVVLDSLSAKDLSRLEGTGRARTGSHR